MIIVKILVVCQYYYPEPFRITGICEELVKRGHEVTVLTGEPNYPEGFIYAGYEKHDRSDEDINGVFVHRCRIIPRKTGTLYRFLNYYSFVFSSLFYVLSGQCKTMDDGSFDVVFIYQLSPVVMAEAGLMYKRIYKVPVVLYCLDLWPESLIAGGIKKDSIVYKVFHCISKRIYNSADSICVTSKSFAKYFNNAFDINNILYLPQYAEDLFYKCFEKKKTKTIHLTFAGNIGIMQSVDTILKAAKELIEEPVHFHIVGGGSELQSLKDSATEMNLSNVTFYGRRSIDEMPHFFSQSDAMLITMKADPGISLTLPGKVQSYMAAGKPIIGSIDGETMNVIESAKCGFCGKADDVDELITNIRLFINSDDKVTMGRNAKEYYDTHFSQSVFMDTLEKELRRVQ